MTPTVSPARLALPLLTVFALLNGCAPNAVDELGTTVPPTSTTSVETAPSTATRESAGECTPELLHPPDSALDTAIDGVASRYNLGNAGGIVDIIGDGPVFDPMLDPLDGIEVYPTIADWVEAGADAGDNFGMFGYTVGSEPVAFHANRSSDVLAAAGVESVGVSVFAYVQECEYRIVVGPEVTSGDDACSVYAIFGSNADAPAPEECTVDAGAVGRTSHVAIWTGEEMIVWGGTRSGLTNANLTSGVAFDPSSGSWRRIADITVADGESLGYGSIAVWTGAEMLVVGPTADRRLGGHAYTPETDTWRAIAPIPMADRDYVGAWVWTGSELLLWGGDQNYVVDDG